MRAGGGKLMDIGQQTYDKIIETYNDVKHIRRSVDQLGKQLNDHEKRIRTLEKCSIEDHEERIRVLEEQQSRWLGRNAAIGFLIVVLLQILSIIAGGRF
jgi:hypothetical protein